MIFLGSEILLTITRRSRSATGTKQDQSTLGTVWIIILISTGACVFVAGRVHVGMLPNANLFALLGVVLFAAGLLLRWWAIITLGRFSR